MIWRRLLKILAVLTVLLICGAIAAAVYLLPKYRELQKVADSFDLKELNAIPALSEVFESNGQRYSRLSGEIRYVVPYAKISPNFTKALIAREDSRFYEHHGVDYRGIFRAALRNISAGGVREGASTITQQLARNTYPLGQERWRKKFVEALLALRIEQHLTKEQILEAYANRIYYGLGLYGIETASRACFGKSASNLTLSEAAILAGLIRSPNRLTPLDDSRKAIAERDQVLARMAQLGMITPQEEKTAKAEEIPASKRLPPVLQEDYAMDAVLRDLSILLPKSVIDRGGLKIYTTIDRRLQLIARDLVDQKLSELERKPGWKHPLREATAQATSDDAPTASPYIQGALVAIDNETGGIRAIIGGRDFKDSPYNRAILAKRQLGSTFKPFVYAAAFQSGLLPGTLVNDDAIAEGEIEGAKGWSPENSDRTGEGLLPAALGLIRSRNTMAIRVGQFARLPAVHDLAAKAGFADVPMFPAIFLGAFEQTLKDATAAYTTFACEGTRKQPYIIDRIEDRDGRILYKATRAELPMLKPSVNYVVNQLLKDVLRTGTGAAAKSLGLTIPAAGKTGTTDDYKDAWFIGYSTRLTCGVWVGMDKPERIMDRGYGSALALPIWVGFMEEAAKWKYEAKEFPTPENLQVATLCRASGRLATEGCDRYNAQLPADLIPSESCTVHQPIYATVPTAPAANAQAIPAAIPVNYPNGDSRPSAMTFHDPVETATPLPGQQSNPTKKYRITEQNGAFTFEQTP